MTVATSISVMAFGFVVTGLWTTVVGSAIEVLGRMP